jgi:hypothetical protein
MGKGYGIDDAVFVAESFRNDRMGDQPHHLFWNHCHRFITTRTQCTNQQRVHDALSPPFSIACTLVVRGRLFARGCQDQSQSCSTKANSRDRESNASTGRFGPTFYDDILLQITSVGTSTRIQTGQCRIERASTSRIDDWSVGHVRSDRIDRQRARHWSELCRAIFGPCNQRYVNSVKERELYTLTRHVQMYQNEMKFSLGGPPPWHRLCTLAHSIIKCKTIDEIQRFTAYAERPRSRDDAVQNDKHACPGY